MKDSAILQYLENQKGITVKTSVIHSRIRDQQNKLTRFCSGDRFGYVKGQFSPVLHVNAIVESHRCQILHKSQSDARIRCCETTHRTHETEKCKAYVDDEDVIIIKSQKFLIATISHVK